jgi:sporulation protein YlmC with PRC-barrel domain
VPQNPEDDLRSKDVYHADGRRVGSVEDLYIDRHEREVRFLEVGTGGFLGIGKKRLLVPVESVTEVTQRWVTIEAGRTEKVDGAAPFDTKVAPPPANDRKSDDYTSLPFGNAEGTADQRDDIRSPLPYGRRPY